MSLSASISTLESFSMPHSNTANRPTGPAPMMATSVVRGEDGKDMRGWFPDRREPAEEQLVRVVG